MELANVSSLNVLTISAGKGRGSHGLDELDGLSSGAAAALAGLNRIKEAGAAVDMARRNLNAVRPLAD